MCFNGTERKLFCQAHVRRLRQRRESRGREGHGPQARAHGLHPAARGPGDPRRTRLPAVLAGRWRPAVPPCSPSSTSTPASPSPPTSASPSGPACSANQTSQDAPLLDGEVPRVKITDPAHPLSGQTLPVFRKPRGAGRSTTDLEGSIPADALSRTPLPVSIRTFLPLAHHVARLLQAAEENPDDTQPTFAPRPPDSSSLAGDPAATGTIQPLASPGTAA